MGFEFLIRTRKTSVLTALVLSPVIAFYVNVGSAGGFVIGCAWSLVNLHVIGLLIGSIVEGSERNKTRVTLIALIQAPVLYAAGFVALSVGVFPVISLLAGFLWPLFIITLKAMGRMVLRLDDGRTISRVNSR